MARKRLPSREKAQWITDATRGKSPQAINTGPPDRKTAAQSRNKTPHARSALPQATPRSRPTVNTPEEATQRMTAHHERFAARPGASPVARPGVSSGLSTGSKIGLGVAGAGTLAAGGYAIHRARSRKKVDMAKTLINPYEEVVVFGKAVALPVPSAVRIRTPNLNSGSHRGNALALVRIRNARGGGGPATALEHYTTSTKGGRQGPFGHKGNSKIPDGARRGRRIA